ncbi:MAG: hypothetical protein AAF564_13530 [Bacteroidota bacterium]
MKKNWPITLFIMATCLGCYPTLESVPETPQRAASPRIDENKCRSSSFVMGFVPFPATHKPSEQHAMPDSADVFLIISRYSYSDIGDEARAKVITFGGERFNCHTRFNPNKLPKDEWPEITCRQSDVVYSDADLASIKHAMRSQYYEGWPKSFYPETMFTLGTIKTIAYREEKFQGLDYKSAQDNCIPDWMKVIDKLID